MTKEPQPSKPLTLDDMSRYVAGLEPESPPASNENSRHQEDFSHRLLVDLWLDSHSVTYRTEQDGDKTLFYIEGVCHEDHGKGTDTAIIQFANGALGFKCQHDTCNGVNWQAIKSKIGWPPRDDLYDPPKKPRSKPKPPRVKPDPVTCDGESILVRYQRITSAELDAGDYEQEYLIPNVLVAGQPCIIAGPHKTLKTSIVIDGAVTLSIGGCFLQDDRFKATRTAKVAIMTGESGLATVQETARRICKTKGVELADLDIIWSPDLPRFDSVVHVGGLVEFLKADDIEVVIIDPAYLAMPSDNSGNLFAQGELLRNVSEACREAKAMLILAHHTKKNRLGERYDPMELEDIAWAGFQEFARQWLLVGRRAAYDHGSGFHELWLTTGGSAGHSGLWGVDVDEGEYVAGMERKWEVTVNNATETRREYEEKKVRQAAIKKGELDEQYKRQLWDALQAYPDGETRNVLSQAAGLNSSNLATAEKLLRLEGRVIDCKIKKGNGENAATKPKLNVGINQS